MITLRRERVLCLAIFIVVVFVLGPWTTDRIEEALADTKLPSDTHDAPGIPSTERPLTRTHQQKPPPKDVPKPPSPPSIGPPTTIPISEHAYGFTILDHLYLRGGTFYVMTSEPSSFPLAKHMLNQPLDLDLDQDPTDKELQFLAPEDAQSVLGDYAMKIRDVSVIIYDPPQFLHHFYHWWGEIILGAWRVLSKVEVKSPTEDVRLPARFLVPFSDKGEWRDGAGVDGPLMRAAFPHAAIEQSDYWQDLIKLNTTVVFERVMLVNRKAAHHHPLAHKWFKMVGGTMNVAAPDDFWAPVRQSLVQNVLGYVPDVEGQIKPIVTYISRQGVGRRLRESDHEALLDGLAELKAEGICEVQIAKMELLSLREQIMLAVHGNGLTHQLWMPRSRRSTVIEIFDPPSYLFDYEMLARNFGHKHYAIWNDKSLTYPEGSYHDGTSTSETFNGLNIPVDASTIIKLLRERLSVS